MKPATALLILAVAWVANRLVRRSIRRLVASMSEDRGLAALRAPDALARTGDIASLRRVQRPRRWAPCWPAWPPSASGPWPG